MRCKCENARGNCSNKVDPVAAERGARLCDPCEQAGCRAEPMDDDERAEVRERLALAQAQPLTDMLKNVGDYVRGKVVAVDNNVVVIEDDINHVNYRIDLNRKA